MDYLSALDVLHNMLTPVSYVEIGCKRGRSLSLSRSPAIAIDPDFKIQYELQHPTRIFRQTSDEFFANNNLRELLCGALDLGFVDGMHLAEYALRDILNLEAYANHNSVVVVDDVLPEQIEWATRKRRTNSWTGDVYKIIPFLRNHRPDLEVRVFDIHKKGLAVITGFNPGDRQIQKNLAEHEAELISNKLAYSSIKELRAALAPESASTLTSYAEELRSRREALPAQV